MQIQDVALKTYLDIKTNLSHLKKNSPQERNLSSQFFIQLFRKKNRKQFSNVFSSKKLYKKNVHLHERKQSKKSWEIKAGACKTPIVHDKLSSPQKNHRDERDVQSQVSIISCNASLNLV